MIHIMPSIIKINHNDFDLCVGILWIVSP